MKTNRLTEIKNKEHELKSQHQLENAFDKKRGSVEFKPQKINSKNIYPVKSKLTALKKQFPSPITFLI
jgi:hypothetical protein